MGEKSQLPPMLRSMDTAYIHPAEREYISCYDLNILIKTVGYLRRQLSFLSLDITRYIRYKKSIIYLLDFSELYSYLWPKECQSQYKVISNYLLTNSNLTFAIPPGTLIELIHKLHIQAVENSELRNTITEMRSDPVISAFFDCYNLGPQSFMEMSTELFEEVTNKILDALRKIDEVDGRLTRLSYLKNSGRIKPLSDFVDTSLIFPNIEILNDALFQLTSYRPGRDDIVNYIDAHNYAITYSLNTKLYNSKDYFFLLVTSSSIPYKVFDTIKWIEDPLFASDPNNIIRTSLVRHPIQLVYSDYLFPSDEDNKKSWKENLKITERIKTDLESLHKKWNDLSIFQNYIKHRGTQGSFPIKLPKEKDYTKRLSRFKRFYEDVFKPIGDLVSTGISQENNRRLLRRIDTSDIGGFYQCQDSDNLDLANSCPPYSIFDYRSIIELFDKFLKLTEAEIKLSTKDLAKYTKEAIIDLDRTGILFQPDKFKLEETHNLQTNCNEFKALIKSPSHSDYSLFFCADVYKDYFCIWWRTSVDFNEFMKAFRYYIRNIARELENGSLEDFANKKRQFQGVCFYLDNNYKSFDLDKIPDFRSNTLLQLCEPQWSIRFIRLSILFGDIYYDFEPINSNYQQVCLTSHLKSISSIADLLQLTHSRNTQKRVIRNIIEAILKNYKH